MTNSDLSSVSSTNSHDTFSMQFLSKPPRVLKDEAELTDERLVYSLIYALHARYINNLDVSSFASSLGYPKKKLLMT